MPDGYTIVGAGLAGSLMALLLGRDDYQVDVYERRPDPRVAGADVGRSINLAISARGLHALDQVGLKDEILAMAVPMRGRMIHDATGHLTFQAYGTRHQAINSVSRAGLNIALLNAASRLHQVRLHFGLRCTEVDLEQEQLEFTTLKGELSRVHAGDTIIGADGAFSAIRTQMQKRELFDYSQSYLAHGYKELYIPPRPGGGFQMEPNALHIWPRGGFMMIALPNQDGSFTCTLFWPFEGPNSFANLRSPEDVLGFFQETYPDAVPLMPTLAQDFFANPTGSLVTVRCSPWHIQEKVVLLGDAAHAIVPFYGQGANAAFEDCVALAQCLKQNPHNRLAAFEQYDRTRKPNADAISALALANFIEMRDRVASPWFRLKKKVEKLLHALFPHWFIPLYTMVSFTTIPYAEAVEKAARQDAAMRWGAGIVVLLLIGTILALVL
ncbi:MAG TPA: NAD(P)/FAD-dependent oxidoreductase [Gemmatimonadales bacterium]|nr:NAD(P)/FAD-dependent oxidoreductase [Gemmatimonadales bacterium]